MVPALPSGRRKQIGLKDGVLVDEPSTCKVRRTRAACTQEPTGAVLHIEPVERTKSKPVGRHQQCAAIRGPRKAICEASESGLTLRASPPAAGMIQMARRGAVAAHERKLVIHPGLKRGDVSSPSAESGVVNWRTVPVSISSNASPAGRLSRCDLDQHQPLAVRGQVDTRRLVPHARRNLANAARRHLSQLATAKAASERYTTPTPSGMKTAAGHILIRFAHALRHGQRGVVQHQRRAAILNERVKHAFTIR